VSPESGDGTDLAPILALLRLPTEDAGKPRLVTGFDKVLPTWAS